MGATLETAIGLRIVHTGADSLCNHLRSASGEEMKMAEAAVG